MSPHIEAKHKAIKEKYHKLYREGLRDEVIVERLAKEFFHSAITIEAIVWDRGGYYYRRNEK
jgi:hypothetical protein